MKRVGEIEYIFDTPEEAKAELDKVWTEQMSDISFMSISPNWLGKPENSYKLTIRYRLDY